MFAIQDGRSVSNQNKTALVLASQVTFTFSKLTIETQNKVWNMFNVNNKNTRTAPVIVNFKHIWHLFLVFLLLTLNK